MKVDVIYVALFRIWPPYSGASSVTWGCVVHTSGRRMLLQVGEEAARATAEGIEVVSVKGGAGRWGRLLAFPRILRSMLDEIQSCAPQIVVVEGASWAYYSWRLIRALGQLDPRPRILYHSHNVEYLLRKPRSGPLVRWLTKRAEGRILHVVDGAYAVSEREVEQFEELYGVRPKLWPNGIDASRYSRPTVVGSPGPGPSADAEHPIVLFLGSYAYRPNAEAIDFLVKRVFPALLRVIPEARLAVLGGKVPYAHEWLIAPGEVPHEDVPAWVRAGQVGVAPVFSGAGTRVKILEYMAAGLPVVATSKGAEGLAVRSGEEFLLAENKEAFVEALQRVLLDSALAATLSRRGRELVQQRYDWPAILRSCGLRNADSA